MTLDPLRRVLESSAARDPRFVLISDRTVGARPWRFRAWAGRDGSACP